MTGKLPATENDFIPQIKPTTEAKSINDVLTDPGSESSQGNFIPQIKPTGNLHYNSDTIDNPMMKKKKPFYQTFYKNKFVQPTIFVLLVVLVLGAIVAWLTYGVYKDAMVVKAQVDTLQAAAQSQDLNLLKTELNNTKVSVADFKKSYAKVSWMKVLPFAGAYVSDGQHAIAAAEHGFEAGDVMLEVIEPYADLLGFTGGTQAKSGEETAKDRIDFVVKTIPGIIPKSDALAEKVALVQKEIDFIDPNRYPENFQGKPVRERLKKGIELLDSTSEFIINSKPLLEVAPYLLGTEGERTYLVIFQNDKELRPTGGFITAYSIAKVENGKFVPVSSSDIYDLDANYKPTIAASDPVVKYLKGPYLISKNYRLRDMNWSPDFAESMALFAKEAQTQNIGKIDGIIAVDTQTLVNLLDVIGPIGVPGFGNFGTQIVPECNCPQVIYELESFADVEGPVVWSENEPGKIVFAPPNYGNRKGIIGPLMNSILSNALGQPKEKIPLLFQAGFESVMQKHVLLYMFDDKAQVAIEKAGYGGKVVDTEGDYLHINDANLGGRKSNLYVQQEVVQEVTIARDGSVEKTVTITYKNPEKHDGWLNSVLPSWFRIYVPKGSELISLEGLEDKAATYEDLGKTVFSGLYQLRPQGVAKVTVKYKLPFKVEDEYTMLIQKQAGTDAPAYSVEVGRQLEEFKLTTDKLLKFKL
jgi:hypothetical protein